MDAWMHACMYVGGDMHMNMAIESSESHPNFWKDVRGYLNLFDMFWLVVSNPLKHISQLGWLSPIYIYIYVGKWKMFQTANQCSNPIPMVSTTPRQETPWASLHTCCCRAVPLRATRDAPRGSSPALEVLQPSPNSSYNGDIKNLHCSIFIYVSISLFIIQSQFMSIKHFPAGMHIQDVSWTKYENKGDPLNLPPPPPAVFESPWL